MRRGPTKEWKEAISGTREPLVDVVEGEKDVRVIAELPGARKQDVELTADGRRLSISAETPSRKYRKELELPVAVKAGSARSTFNNGILEVTLAKHKPRRSGVRIKVD